MVDHQYGVLLSFSPSGCSEACHLDHDNDHHESRSAAHLLGHHTRHIFHLLRPGIRMITGKVQATTSIPMIAFVVRRIRSLTTIGVPVWGVRVNIPQETGSPLPDEGSIARNPRFDYVSWRGTQYVVEY